MKNHLIILLLFLSIGCSQKEYDIKQIVKRDGVYYPEFNDEDLNGRVYEMFGFKKVYMGIIKNGKQDGLWTDEDFTRFRFGNYTIDYEVAYLSLPPNESEKSNQVTTTTGNWSGPLGKTRADKYTLNIFPNPFNSSVTIPLNEEIHTVSIYNILGETIKKYSHVDLISKNQIVWNGLDKYGNEVSTGTYFVILVSDNKIQTRKVVFAK